MNLGAEPELSVGQFVALLNQTLEYAYPSVTVTGELANFRLWRERLVFFDLKDETAVVNCFAYATQLPGPLEDGMVLRVKGRPQVHATRGFSFNVQFMQPAGEGSLKKAAQLLQAKLAAEGLFDPSRKRQLPYPPQRIGLITAVQSAAYADFIKVLGARWQGMEVEVLDSQVQGEAAPQQLVAAIEQFNSLAELPEVLVLIRGGGSAEDLAAFNHEAVTRAVAASRIPTLVAIGHEVDVSLAELAADLRASTPSNAAELLVPDRRNARRELQAIAGQLHQHGQHRVAVAHADLKHQAALIRQLASHRLDVGRAELTSIRQLLAAYDPQAVLRRGYAVVRSRNKLVRSSRQLKAGAVVNVRLAEGRFTAAVNNVEGK